jgi:eukaryotic-like serine/threonine-protein kinase
MLAPGSRLGRYTIISYLGCGGMGEVYVASDARLSRRVAIKVLARELAVQGDSLERFRREARAASMLNHPAIVHIYDIDEEEIGDGSGDEPQRVQFIAMELVDGTTLRQMIPAGVGAPSLLQPLIQIAGALAKAHEAGIVHRDLKPENIMLTRDGYAKLVDFGLAKLVDRRAAGISDEESTAELQTSPGLVRGTAPYMSPEQIRGEPADARSDIFSFGCILYEVACGVRPFEAPVTVDVLHKILHDNPPILGVMNPALPREWTEVVGRCLAKDPAARYQTARELATDLRHLSQLGKTEPTVAIQRPRNRFWRWKRSHLAVAAAITALVVAVGVLVERQRAHHAPDAMRSIAVLPFENATHQAESDYLADGMTDSVINALSQIRDLRVMSRTSVFQIRKKNLAPVDAGRALGVDAIVAGDIAQHGEAVDIHAELIDVSDGARLWGDHFSTHFADILPVQNSIAREIALKLRRPISGEEQQRIARVATDDPEAYRLYLKGRYQWNKRTAGGLTNAIGYFRQAIDRDSSYARAWAGLADSYALLEQYAGIPSRENCPKARAAAQRALEVDPQLPEAHATLGLLCAHCDWDWKRSEGEFKRAVELNPNYATTHHWYALHLAYLKQFDRARAEARSAQTLDPLSLIATNAIIVVESYARNYGAALEQCRKNLEMDPEFPVTYMWIGRDNRDKGDFSAAIDALRKAVALSGGHSAESVADLGFAYARAGRTAEAEATLAQLRTAPLGASVAPYHEAVVLAALGRRDEAIAALGRAMENHSWFLVQLAVDPAFDSIHDDPRFQEMLAKTGLRQAAAK